MKKGIEAQEMNGQYYLIEGSAMGRKVQEGREPVKRRGKETKLKRV